MATALAGLKLTAAKRSNQVSPVQQRRNKMLKRLAEQVELAKAKQEGRQYAPTKQAKVLDEETGEKRTVQVAKRIKEWWFSSDGKICISLRYGATIVELKKGMTSVELASDKDLVKTLEVLATTVQNGEIDAQLEAASGAVKAGFKK
jgi:hypothetical protein